MPNWNPVPFVRLLIPLTIGIVIQEYLQLETLMFWSGGLLMMILGFLLYLSFKRIPRKWRWVFGTLTNSALIISGILLHFFHQENNTPDHFKAFIEKKASFHATILDIIPKGKNFRLILKVQSIQTEETHPVNGRLLAYLPIDSISQNLVIGDHILVKAYISKTQKALNPKAFDFSAYLHLQNIHYQTFINSESWTKTLEPISFSFKKMAVQIQGQCLAILKKHLSGKNEQAVASALILGYKSGLDNELKSAYADTGAMHVLAVSGLHTGFIYLLVQYLLKLIPLRSLRWKIIKTVIIILCLWAFAFITGLSPSVLRSATMFSFVTVGLAINRQSSIYNTLAASAFCLLLFNPLLLFAPGFQLSYLAVAGIVYFHPFVYRLIFIKHKIVDYLWKLVGVSIAAQLSTFPLSLYYFHKVPLYFWLSGLIVVPAAAIILPLGLLLFALDKVPFLGWVIGKLLNGIIWTMNSLIFFLQGLPGTFLDGIWTGPLVFLLICFAIVALIFILEKKQAKWMIAGMSSLLLIAFNTIYSDWQSLGQKEVVIYYQKGETLIDLFDGKQSFTFCTAKQDDSKIQYAVGNYRGYKNILKNSFFPAYTAQVKSGHFMYQNGHFQFGDIRFIVINDKTILPAKKQSCEFLILSDNPKCSLDDLQEAFDFEKIIIDGSNNRRAAMKWKEDCEERGVNCINIFETGAVIVPIE
jgi:competence protein ComEC